MFFFWGGVKIRLEPAGGLLVFGSSMHRYDTHKDSLEVDERVRRGLVVLDNLPCQLGDVVACGSKQSEQIEAAKRKENSWTASWCVPVDQQWQRVTVTHPRSFLRRCRNLGAGTAGTVTSS